MVTASRPRSAALNKKRKKDDIDKVLIETAASLSNQFKLIQDNEPDISTNPDDEDSFFCGSLANRLKRLPPGGKGLVRLQIEQLFYQAVPSA